MRFCRVAARVCPCSLAALIIWRRRFSVKRRKHSCKPFSADPKHRRDIKACAQWLARHLAELGLHHVRVLSGIDGGAPSVYADWLLASGRPTLLLYGHYDVQPVDPFQEWRTLPFKAAIAGDNLYGRGASDDIDYLWLARQSQLRIIRLQGHLVQWYCARRDRDRIYQLVAQSVDRWGFCGIKSHRLDAPITREVCEVARTLRSLPFTTPGLFQESVKSY